MDLLQIDFISNFVKGFHTVEIIAYLIVTANFITVFSPSVTESKTYNIVMKVLNWLSLNVGKNKNADDK